jgi:hypothetical protein
MKQTTFKEKYPVWTLEISKDETDKKSIDEIISYFHKLIEDDPIAVNIAIFDHFNHTKSIGGNIAQEIKGMKNIIFCFGPEIPNTKVAAVRPRSIGVCETDVSFIIEFMEAPSDKAHEKMEAWSKALLKYTLR